MLQIRKSDLFPLLITAILGLLYVMFLGSRDVVLLAIFGLQILRFVLMLATRPKKADG